MEEEYYGYSQGEPRPRFENEHKSTPHLNPRGAEFESIRLATRIEEWYRNRAPYEELTELPAQKGILRISNIDQAVQPRYLYDPEKDDTDFHRKRSYTNHHDADACGDRGHTPWQRSYMNMILKTKDNVVTNANHRIDSSSTTRTHSTNTYVT